MSASERRQMITKSIMIVPVLTVSDSRDYQRYQLQQCEQFVRQANV
jgi:hypothetical protein